MATCGGVGWRGQEGTGGGWQGSPGNFRGSDVLTSQTCCYLHGCVHMYIREGNGTPPPALLPGKSHGTWWAAVHGVAKSQT